MASTNPPSLSSTPISRRSMPILSEAKPMLEEKQFEASYRHAWPLLLGLAMLAGVSYGFAGLVQTYCLDEPLHSSAYTEENVLGENCPAVHREIPWRELERKVRKCHRHEYYDPMHDDCQTCPAETPNDRVFAVFWETQKDCAMLVNDPSTRYVTHVYWAFATVDEKGNVAQSLQYWDDDAIKHCMAQLRMRCIKQLVSIGGADSRHSFFSLQDPKALDRFLKSSIDVVKKFDFDGIDMDDETGNSKEARDDWLKNQSPTVLKYLAGLRDGMEAIRKPNEPKYLLTWDEFPTSYDQPSPGYAGCAQVYEGGWRRCIPNQIKDLVDWVNIMYYNMPSNGDYDEMMHHRIPKYWVPAIGADKLLLGACSSLGCVEPMPPPGQAYKNAFNGSALYKGTMLWSGTNDLLFDKGHTTEAMGRAGNYGVRMPYRPIAT